MAMDLMEFIFKIFPKRYEGETKSLRDVSG